jgi:hypothetical protein
MHTRQFVKPVFFDDQLEAIVSFINMLSTVSTNKNSRVFVRRLLLNDNLIISISGA